MLRYFSLLCILILLVGCGQKGPLYLPKAEKAQEQTHE